MDVKEHNGIKNIKIINNKKFFNCVQCGKCCHIRETDKGISSEDEEKYRQYMFAKFGIIYLARLSDITINVWPEEAEILKEIAKDRNIRLKIVPKRAIYDKSRHELLILDYFLDHNICPFYKDKSCTIYTSRPLICRSYPMLTTQTLGKCEYKLDNPLEYDQELFEAKKLELVVNMQKQIIESMITSKSIIVPETISDVEMDDILRTAKFKELRILDKIKDVKLD